MTIRPDPTFHAQRSLRWKRRPRNTPTRCCSAPISRGPMRRCRSTSSRIPHVQQVVHTVTMPNKGDEFHHFGWNACSSALSPLDRPRLPRAALLIIPGHPLLAHLCGGHQARPDPGKDPQDHRAGGDLRKTGYSRPHTVHCGPEGIYVSTLGGGGKDGTDGRPASSSWTAKHSRSSAAGRSTADRRTCTMISGGTCRATTWCRANGGCRRNSRTGSSRKTCSRNKYGHRIHFWDLRARRNVQTIDLGANHQMALEVRPAHDPVREYGFLGVVVDTTNLEGSIWTWWREGGKFHIEKTATIPPEPAPKDQLPPLLAGFGAVPPLVTDIDLSHGRQVPLRRLLGHRRDASVRR